MQTYKMTNVFVAYLFCFALFVQAAKPSV
jgi:hypothetical protein